MVPGGEKGDREAMKVGGFLILLVALGVGSIIALRVLPKFPENTPPSYGKLGKREE